MRAAEWLFVISATLFVAGVGFVVVGARSARQAPAERQAAPPARIASVRQVMLAIVDPAATVVFESVSTTITKAGIEEKRPDTDAKWEAVGASAAALAEAGQLLMAEGRAIDRQDWVREAQAMVDASREVLAAVDAKSAQGVFDAGGALYTSCAGCHEQYMR